jgi:ABC-type transport system substrate-binding protein
MCVGNNAPTSPTNAHLLIFYHTEGPQASTWRQLADSELDTMIEEQAIELDNERRGELLKEIQRKVIDLAAVIPLYTSNGEFATAPSVQGYKNAISIDNLRWQQVWLNA